MKGRGLERIAVFGSTGSIGQSTLDLIALHPERFRAEILTAHRQVDRMFANCQTFRPSLAVMTDSDAARALRAQLAQTSWGSAITVADGPQTRQECAASADIDTVVAGIVGAAGLPSVLAAARAGKKILLANKEALVMAGALMVDAARQGGAVVLPVDSEHNAIFQCLGENYRCFVPPEGVNRLLLTASGGPFRTWDKERIFSATVSQAIAHPNWSMGRKISVDSATMMNKGLELIEAHWLFALPESAIDVVVHPQSVVHSMVEFHDGSTLAQLGSPDMRTPIACAMSWPKRIHAPVKVLDWTAVRQLDFEPPDDARFPSLALARQSLRAGGASSAVLNAANEVAVEAFLNGGLKFGQIFRVVAATLDQLSLSTSQVPQSIEALLAIDQEARGVAANEVSRLHP
ncbi:MAG: 1-deoxy-D-xylulose-5-phosphate reductoisomerase [Burkholderiaceae bacterium]|nr:1-deoxy-D-xylulose-5-phosphate reductoisomerase [Burkholderiaceae bacterium]